MSIISRRYRSLLLSAVLAVAAALCLSGCGGGDDGNPDGNNNNNSGSGGGSASNTCTSAEKCKSKEMPDGKIWMTENLNIWTANSWCYGNVSSNCDTYGRLYDWYTALTVCPNGWHLPTREEWRILAIAAGGTGTKGDGGTAGKNLKSRNNNVDGTDKYGFSGLLGGWMDVSGYFGGMGSNGDYWSASEDNEINAHHRDLNYGSDDLEVDSDPKGEAYYIRCVKD